LVADSDRDAALELPARIEAEHARSRVPMYW
jgi:hypothetical protein